MTLIIGYETKDGFIIAADSCGQQGGEVQSFKTVRKIGINNGLVVGTSGSLAMNNQVLYRFGVPDYDGSDPLRYLVRDFVPALRVSMTEHKLLKDDSLVTETSTYEGWEIIVGIDNRIFNLDSWFAVRDTIHGFDTIGSGCEYAKGAIAVIGDSDSPQGAIYRAMKAATVYDRGVAPPYHAIIKENGELREVELG